MKINKLEIENVKRVRALTLEPSANGLTVNTLMRKESLYESGH